MEVRRNSKQRSSIVRGGSKDRESTIFVGKMFILALFFVGTTGTATRPEDTLLDVFAKPFVPTDATAASAKCIEDSAIYLQALRNYTPWALQMYDASAKISPGILTGNIKQLGNYDQCLRIRTSHGFLGQSCAASIQFEVADNATTSNDNDMKDLLTSMALASGLKNWTHGRTVKYEWSWCVPSTCTYTEIEESLHILLDQLQVEGRLDLIVNVSKNSCHTAKTDERKFDVADWIYIGIVSFFLVITVASTVIDYSLQANHQNRRKDKKYVILTAFSIYTNGKSILNTRRHVDSIGCLDGLRFISICWIIYGHTHYLQATGVQLDVSHVSRMHENWSTLLVLNGNIVTDTFFLLSGLLLAYTEHSQKQRNPEKTLNVPRLYAHRYFRLTPAYAMIVALYATIYYKFGSGPQWNSNVGVQRDLCRKNWWTNLLYVNNMVNVGGMCMSQTWYLSVDMQLVWISPIFLYPMIKFRRSIFFWTVFGIGLFISIAVPFAITYAKSLTATMLYYKNLKKVAHVYLAIYTKTYARAGPYIIGLGLGYLLSQTKSLSVKIPKVYAIGGWIVSGVCMGSVVFGPRGMYFDEYVYNRIESSVYAGLHRVVFALSISWIIFACTRGIGGPVNAFLSWKAWMPLSRLTYSAYLSHYLVLFYNSGIVRTPGYLTSYTVVHEFFGNLVLVMIVSLLLALIFEMPFLVLDRALFGNSGRKLHSTLSGRNMESGSGVNRISETYRTFEGSISSVSQMYASINEPTKLEEAAYVNPIVGFATYYEDQNDQLANCEHRTRQEHVRAEVHGSERSRDDERTEKSRRRRMEGVDNGAYQH